MSLLLHPFLSVGLLSAGISLAVAVIVWRQPDAPGARTYAVLLIVLGIWSLLYVGQLFHESIVMKRPWLVARHAISAVVGILFWLFAAKYTGRPELLSRRYMTPIVGGGALLTGIQLFNPMNSYWVSFSLYTGDSVPRMDITFGPLFFLFVAYIFAVVGAGHWFIVKDLRDSFSVYRRQLSAMTVVGIIEFVIFIVFFTEHIDAVRSLNPWPHLQLVTYNMVFVALPLGWSYLRESLFELQPIRRQAVIENMGDAVFVFDTQDQLRNSNAPASALIGGSDLSAVEGKPASAVFSEHPKLLDAYRSGQTNTQHSDENTIGYDGAVELSDDAVELSDESLTGNDSDGNLVELSTDDGKRFYDLRVSTIETETTDDAGTVVVARDVTIRRKQREMLSERTAELENRKAELERQNERLDQFTSMVSHDLRNPLGVAEMYLEFARDTGDEDDFEAVSEALDRMDTMIDELLTIASADTTVESREQITLHSLASDAWETTQADGGTIEFDIGPDTVVRGDRELLRNVFENLYRNALDHNEPPVLIRVGTLDKDRSGFYVEDDGTGIPEDDREQVFEYGHTTSDSGSGFGLHIVSELITAHDWEIGITESPDGGARFEVYTDSDDIGTA
jgi:signal transduction histidine kinase